MNFAQCHEISCFFFLRTSLSSSITVQCKGIKRRANIKVNICLSADTPAKHNKRDPHKSLRKNSIIKNFSLCLEFKLNRVSNFYIIARMPLKKFLYVLVQDSRLDNLLSAYHLGES